MALALNATVAVPQADAVKTCGAGDAVPEGGGAYLPGGQIATLGGHFPPPKKHTNLHIFIDSMDNAGMGWLGYIKLH